MPTGATRAGRGAARAEIEHSTSTEEGLGLSTNLQRARFRRGASPAGCRQALMDWAGQVGLGRNA